MCLAVPGRILEVQNEDPLLRAGRVDFGGVIKEVNLACVPDAGPGDYVIVHAGLAISRLDEEEARQTLADLRRMGELAAPRPESTGPPPPRSA